MVNVTQLGTAPKRRFKIRHGLTYEQDALLTKIIHPGGLESLDLIGRAVVLAFRLSGMTAAFPGITAQREIVEVVGGGPPLQFRRWIPTAEEGLKFFKGEKWGTNALYVSGAKKPRTRSKIALVKQATLVIQKAEAQGSIDDTRLVFSRSLYDGMMAGPEWSRKVAADYTQFIREELLGSLKVVLRAVDETQDAK